MPKGAWPIRVETSKLFPTSIRPSPFEGTCDTSQVASHGLLRVVGLQPFEAIGLSLRFWRLFDLMAERVVVIERNTFLDVDVFPGPGSRFLFCGPSREPRSTPISQEKERAAVALLSFFGWRGTNTDFGLVSWLIPLFVWVVFVSVFGRKWVRATVDGQNPALE